MNKQKLHGKRKSWKEGATGLGTEIHIEICQFTVVSCVFNSCFVDLWTHVLY